MRKYKDLTGQKFNRLTVLYRTEDYVSPKGKRDIVWHCQCECGNECNIRAYALKSGHAKSCGCLNNETRIKQAKKLGKKSKKYNKYDLSGDYGIGYTSKGEEFWFDLEDYDLIKDYSWSYSCGYVVAPHGEKLHRIIMNAQEEDVVDHIIHGKTNENKYDNRKSNLRKVTHSKNAMNQHIKSNNTSGVKGVSWHKRDLVWEVNICVNRKIIYLGSYENFDEAVRVRKEAEDKYFGEYKLKE